MNPEMKGMILAFKDFKIAITNIFKDSKKNMNIIESYTKEPKEASGDGTLKI